MPWTREQMAPRAAKERQHCYHISRGIGLPGVTRPLVAFKPDNVQSDRQLDQAARPARIRCPLCHWQPSRSSRWYCTPMGAPENFSGGCGHGWNTFDTRGRCPGCSYQWRHTWCFGCNRPSPHDDWYVPAGRRRP